MTHSTAERRTFQTRQGHARRGSAAESHAELRRGEGAFRSQEMFDAVTPYEVPSRALSPGGSYRRYPRTSTRARCQRPARGAQWEHPPAAPILVCLAFSTRHSVLLEVTSSAVSKVLLFTGSCRR